MVFYVDKEAGQILTQLCDLALKSAGLQNLKIVNRVNENTLSITPEMQKWIDDHKEKVKK